MNDIYWINFGASFSFGEDCKLQAWIARMHSVDPKALRASGLEADVNRWKREYSRCSSGCSAWMDAVRESEPAEYQIFIELLYSLYSVCFELLIETLETFLV